MAKKQTQSRYPNTMQVNGDKLENISVCVPAAMSHESNRENPHMQQSACVRVLARLLMKLSRVLVYFSAVYTWLLASIPRPPLPFAFTILNTREWKTSEKWERPGSIHHMNDVKWT